MNAQVVYSKVTYYALRITFPAVGHDTELHQLEQIVARACPGERLAGLQSYRMLLALRRAAEAHERADFAASKRARNGALTLLGVTG